MSADSSTIATSARLVTDWQTLKPADAEAIIEFWRRERAIDDSTQARQRLAQVVAHGVDASGAITAVCTAVATTLPRLGQPMYYYRCFVGRASRGSGWVVSLLQHATQVLETHARERDFPCIGIVLELENASFENALRAPFWSKTGFTYIGLSSRGLELRVRYFHGAQLKDRARS